jgi:DNA repair exonuclease SbcCD ATPase subunit
MGHSLEAAQHQSAPAQGAAAIDALRRNVQALYNDARGHMRMERDAATHVTRVQTQVAELQRAFRHLAEVAVEELEELREDVERNAAAIEAVRLANEVKPLKSAVATLERTIGDLAREVAAERARVKKADAERDQRIARLEKEMVELRAAMAGDRQALNAAVSTVRDLSTTMGGKQASSEASLRAVHETLAALGRRQVALEVEVEALGTTFRRRALVSASNGSARAPACGRDADGEGAGLDTGLGTGAEASGSALASTIGCSSGGHASAPSGMSPLSRTRHVDFGLDVERNTPPHIRYRGLHAPSAPGGGTRTAGGGDPIYAKALAEARRELTERVAVGGRRGREGAAGWT